MPNKITQNIPNAITSLNLLSGCISIVFAMEGQLTIAVYLIFIAAIFDFLDGFAARLLKAYSELGKQLDSLSDVVSFGVAPGIILFQLVRFMLFKDYHYNSVSHLPGIQYVYLILPFFIPVFASIRLGKFNIDDRQSEGFLGLAVPANALFFVSFALIYYIVPNSRILMEEWLFMIVVLVPLFSFFMISEIPMFSMKFKTLSVKDNQIRFLFIASTVVLIVILKTIALPLIILLYITLSIINNIVSK